MVGLLAIMKPIYLGYYLNSTPSASSKNDFTAKRKSKKKQKISINEKKHLRQTPTLNIHLLSIIFSLIIHIARPL